MSLSITAADATAQTAPQALCAAVQNNCNIADARHATDYTLCIYLLKMREYFRWEKGYAYSAALPKDDVGEWLKAREQLWGEIEEAPFADIEIEGRAYDPFDAQAINRALIPRGYVYSAGLGVRARPHFFLGRLERREQFAGRTLFVAADECARDLAAPPAMSLEHTIFVRRESLRRMLWEKVQEWRWHPQQNAMARALSFYPFEEDLDTALEAMTAHELDSVLHHEIGEVMAGEALGPEWAELLTSLPRSRAELMARAVRDHLADALSTLPVMIEREDAAALHFYMANLNALRRELFPSFAPAYERWWTGQDHTTLERLVQRAADHWSALGQGMLETYRRQPRDYTKVLEQLISESAL